MIRVHTALNEALNVLYALNNGIPITTDQLSRVRVMCEEAQEVFATVERTFGTIRIFPPPKEAPHDPT